MKYLLQSLICLILLTACERNTKNNTSFSVDDYLHVIDLNKTAPEIPLSEVFAKVTPIVLETTKESLLGCVNKVIATPKYLIVYDGLVANALFLFKKDGTFLHRFGSIGKGPGEYSSISDFCYDETTGTIYMLDFQTNRVNLYDIHTGSFLKSIQLRNNNGFSQSIYYQNGELYTDLRNFTNENERYLLNRRNQSTGDIEEVWLDLKTYSKGIDYLDKVPFLFGDGNSFKFNTFFMDGIMSIEKNKITPFLAFTPEYTIDMNDLKGQDLNLRMPYAGINWVKTNKVYNIRAYFEQKNLIYLEFLLGLGRKFKKVLYNQNSREAKYIGHFDDLIFKEEAKGYQYFSPMFIAYGNNGLFSDLEYNDMKNLKELLEKDLISDNFKSAAIELTKLAEDANPVLLHYEFKD